MERTRTTWRRTGAVAVLALAVLLFLPSSPVRGHHSAAIYDFARTLTLEGVVSRYEWVNPHVYLFVRASRDGAGAEEWAIEASAPMMMKRRGWSPASFRIGERVSVEAVPTKDPQRRVALGRTVVKEDGSVLAAMSSAGLFDRPSAAVARSLAGTWLPRLTPAVTGKFIQPRDREDAPGMGARSWPLNARGREAVDGYDPATNPAIDCVAYPPPFTMVVPDLKILEIGEDAVRIRSELDDVERVVHLDADSHDGASFSNQGHSIGRWQDGALIVDTAYFEARPNGNSVRLPSSRQKHLSERFELLDDRSSLRYWFQVEDPEYLEAPLAGELIWDYAPERTFAVDGCNLENARRHLAPTPG